MKEATLARPFPVRTIERIDVYRVCSVFGEGTDESPIREVFQYFDAKSGREIGYYDPLYDDEWKRWEKLPKMQADPIQEGA